MYYSTRLSKKALTFLACAFVACLCVSPLWMSLPKVDVEKTRGLNSITAFLKHIWKPLIDAFVNKYSDAFDDPNEEEDTIPSLPSIDESESMRICKDLNIYFPLTSLGQSVAASEFKDILQDYVECTAFYEDISFVPTVHFGLAHNQITSSLLVGCQYCNNDSSICDDLESNFLKGSLCFPPDASDLFVLEGNSDKIMIHDNGQPSNQRLTLPSNFIPDVSALSSFLDCRRDMGAYVLSDGNDANHLIDDVSFSNFVLSTPDEIQVNCIDPSSNGAFCNDIVTQHASNLACVTKFSGKNGFESAELHYELEFLTGEQFEAIDKKYTKDVEAKLETNLSDYIECRFRNDPRFDAKDFFIHGKLDGSKYKTNCFSKCNEPTIPYCEALSIKREEDSRDDSCYVKKIELEDERVNTVYNYEFVFSVGTSGTTQTFSYNIQSLAENPLARQYYGQPPETTLPTLTSSEEVAQQTNFRQLMRDYGFTTTDLSDALFVDLCAQLTDHVGCGSNERIIKIDVEIPNGIGFRANDVKSRFGTALEKLVLGSNLSEAKNFPAKFFEITNLDTLVMRGRGKLKGSLPDTMSSMTKLKNFDLNQCPPLSSGHEGITGSIPSQIESVPLRLLDLGCNKLTGTLPSQFYTGEKRYKSINLNDNQFSGALSAAEFNQMDKLTQLSLADNDFTGSIPTMPLLTKLKMLDLKNNDFTGQLPNILKKSDSELEIVSLDGNSLTGSIHTKIGNLSELKYLNLKNNNLNGNIPSELALCTKLEVLLLGGNDFSNWNTIPSQLKTFLNNNPDVKHDLPT